MSELEHNTNVQSTLKLSAALTALALLYEVGTYCYEGFLGHVEAQNEHGTTLGLAVTTLMAAKGALYVRDQYRDLAAPTTPPTEE